jgi:hypothetical protein
MSSNISKPFSSNLKPGPANAPAHSIMSQSIGMREGLKVNRQEIDLLSKYIHTISGI